MPPGTGRIPASWRSADRPAAADGGGRAPLEVGRLLFPVVAGATLAGLGLRLAGAAGPAHALWAATTVAVLGSMLFDVAGKLRRGRVGIDVVALLALPGPWRFASSWPERSSE